MEFAGIVILLISPADMAIVLGNVDFVLGFWFDSWGLLVGWNRRAAMQRNQCQSTWANLIRIERGLRSGIIKYQD